MTIIKNKYFIITLIFGLIVAFGLMDIALSGGGDSGGTGDSSTGVPGLPGAMMCSVTGAPGNSGSTSNGSGNGGGWDYYGGGVPSLPTGLSASCPAPGNSATLSWNAVPGATYYWLRVDNLTNGWSDTCNWTYPGDICDNNVGGPSYPFSSTPGASYDWWVHSCSAQGCTSEAVHNSFTCGIPPPPVVTLTTWPVFEIPDLVSLYWSSANADSCVASGDWSGAKATQGEERFSKPSGNYSFTLTCTGPGGSASDTKNVRVIQVPKCSFTANPGSIILPASSTLSWSCEYANSCSIDQGIGSVSSVSGTKVVRPSVSTTYTLTCSGLDGSRSSQATVNIGFEPTRREVPPY